MQTSQCEERRRDSWRRALLSGAACVAIWGALWWLLIYAYQFPGKSAVPGAATCGPGMVELDGACVVGEEIEVRAPRRPGAAPPAQANGRNRTWTGKNSI